MRSVETTTSLASSCGCVAPVSPVRPPCGTIGTRASAHTLTIDCTSSLVRGLSTSRVRPWISSRQDSQ